MCSWYAWVRLEERAQSARSLMSRYRPLLLYLQLKSGFLTTHSIWIGVWPCLQVAFGTQAVDAFIEFNIGAINNKQPIWSLRKFYATPEMVKSDQPTICPHHPLKSYANWVGRNFKFRKDSPRASTRLQRSGYSIDHSISSIGIYLRTQWCFSPTSIRWEQTAKLEPCGV